MFQELLKYFEVYVLEAYGGSCREQSSYTFEGIYKWLTLALGLPRTGANGAFILDSSAGSGGGARAPAAQVKASPHRAKLNRPRLARFGSLCAYVHPV